MKISFYILPDAEKTRHFIFVCRLIEKIYLNQTAIYLHVDSLNMAHQFDQLLWTYRDDSFIPHHLMHEVIPEEKNCLCPIHIGYQDLTPQFSGVIINLQTHVFSLSSHYTEVVEIVFPEPSMQQLARERYKQYRDQGHELITHKIKAHDL